MINVHFLTNREIFLKKQIHIYVEVARFDTPSYTTNNLIEQIFSETLYKEINIANMLQTLSKGDKPFIRALK